MNRTTTRHEGNRARKIIENRYYINDYEVYTKTTNGTVDIQRETLHINDDKQKVAILDTLISQYSNLTTTRYQYTNLLDSASLELDETGDIISYEEYHPFGTTSYRSGRNEVDVSIKRYKYVHKELDNETGLYYYGMRYYAAWIARFVSVDPWNYKYPWETSFAYHRNNPITMIDWKGYGDPPPESERHHAELAAHVYGDEDYKGSIGDWTVSNVADDIKGFVMNDADNSGFKSQIYERTINGKKEYAYVFAGTEDLKKDGVEDLLQTAGLSTQYYYAIKNSELLKKNLGDSKITFIGHSLGGGLAQAAAMKTGGKAVTFNPAWMSKQTINNYGLDPESATIINYVVAGELLHKVQSGTSLYPVLEQQGTTIKLNNIERLYTPSFILHKVKYAVEEYKDLFIKEQSKSERERELKKGLDPQEWIYRFN